MGDKLANPILVSRPAMLAHHIERFGLRVDVDFTVVNPEHGERFRDYLYTYRMMALERITPQ
ncbi:malate dehydrogenase (oxaloacetate-decarboxylating)(NADP+) [Cupriavidus sp. YR651]|nr:malate dehydrogenase (oxaloacetate-decarboxylating)(NADP+) [Cupriavidus sp. YR651]